MTEKQRTKTVLHTKGAEKVDVYMKTHTNKKNIDSDLIPFTKINSKWILDLDVKCKTTQFIVDNMEKPRRKPR